MKLKMLPSKTEYKKIIHQEESLTNEEKEKINNFENYILRSKEYAPFLTKENLEIVQNYEKEISFLESLKERNQNQQEAIQRSKQLLSTLSLEEQNQKKQKEWQKREFQIQNKQQTSAGYLNATILIYITINLGLMIAGLTWMFLK